jgi:hypothetical protein
MTSTRAIEAVGDWSETPPQQDGAASPALLFDRQRAAIVALLHLVQERRRIEEEVVPRFEQAERASAAQHEATLQNLAGQKDTEIAELDAVCTAEQRELNAKLESDLAAVKREHAEALRVLALEEKNARDKLHTGLQDALWAADSLLEAGLKRAEQQRETMRRHVSEAQARADALWDEFLPMLAHAGLKLDDLTAMKKPPVLQGDSLEDLGKHLDRAEVTLHYARDLKVRTWLRLPIQLILMLACVGLCSAPALFLEPWTLWLAAGAPVGTCLAIVQRIALSGMLRRQVRSAGRGLKVLLAQARTFTEELLVRAEQKAWTKQAELRASHAANRDKAEGRYHPQLTQLEERMRAERARLNEEHQLAQERMRQQGKQALDRLRQKHRDGRAVIQARFQEAVDQASARHDVKLQEIDQERSDVVLRSQENWQKGSRQFLGELAELRRAVPPDLFTPLPSLLSDGGEGRVRGVNGDTPPNRESTLSTGLPLGTISVDARTLFEGSPPASIVPLPPQPMDVPAFLPFPRCGGLLFEAHSGGRTSSIQSLQALMVRFLTALPPGKVRFTIIDPVGLGDNFSAFMHLADHDELLVTSRIWTEANHIEKQLAELTEHMENVIQKYLRSQFSSIEEYNRVAGEVAEPYRVLVVANFPINFSPQAARRLVSIVQSGASCGVYALICADARQVMPQGFRLEELAELCLTLRWEGTRFVWDDLDLDRFRLTLETPPENGQLIDLMRRIGVSSRGANRVEVPFSYIVPTEEEVWKGDSRRGLSVPLGRAGAVRKQALRLGSGTSQHVLVAGKTGSGKSTLWHALIVNLALHYSPDEVELFLIDFKKGVEFKPYAEYQLPHARVVAIESEREFGLSVLQRLDGELRSRGDRFRTEGVNDIASYRQAKPEEYCPRVLLIVDEFQEFFVEDDRLSQEAALLLDRLVRQGRAFGLHVLLGSQTLGGAYSLARSTLDQMVVRIALQCSETDAQLILNKDNSAARLLSRPGEAIYNDSSGSLEGNEIFQVVWLSEEERERRLQVLYERFQQTPCLHHHKPPIVFESTTPARLEQNPLLLRTLEQGPLTGSEQPRVWLGEAIAIKDPTAAVLRLQSGCNLLIIGQHEEAAMAMLASSLVSLALQHAPDSARFWLLDSTPSQEVLSGYLPGVLEGWPHAVQFVEPAGLGQALATLGEELKRRLAGGGERDRCYLLIHGIQRFRDIRRIDEEFGFGRRGTERTVSPAEHFQALLRDGPTVGIHLLMWCDQLTNLNRAVDRQGMRDCGSRVLFQMSAADSSHLLDSPAASRLGRNRALFHHDELPQPEKFRPYDLPPLGWLREIQERRRK